MRSPWLVLAPTPVVIVLGKSRETEKNMVGRRR
jgi:hypothetical protein